MPKNITQLVLIVQDHSGFYQGKSFEVWLDLLFNLGSINLGNQAFCGLLSTPSSLKLNDSSYATPGKVAKLPRIFAVTLREHTTAEIKKRMARLIILPRVKQPR